MICPVCRQNLCQQKPTTRDAAAFECAICGEFEISGSLYATALDPEKQTLNAMQRAALSHRLRTTTQTERLVLTTAWFEEFLKAAQLPNPSAQATNYIRVIGDYVSKFGEGYYPDQAAAAEIGAISPPWAHQILRQLIAKDLVYSPGTAERTQLGGGRVQTPVYDLTLDGWNAYDSERRGETAGNFGFLAMKFNEPVLEKFSREILKRVVRESLGYNVIDVRDVSRAGIIDNIMRAQIRDSAFVIVDLTHDNAGAYWEAGYAEGLGKPVIYICEREKFEASQSHFDTNHCTTVLWNVSAPEQFEREIVATLRRSLNLFPRRNEGQ